MAIKTQDFAGVVFLEGDSFDKQVKYKVTQNGGAVLSFQLVSDDRKRNDRDEWETVARHYQRCTVWDAKHYPYATALWEFLQAQRAAGVKRVQLTGTGKLVTRQWQDNDGAKRYSPEVTLWSVAVDVLAVRPPAASQSQAARDWDSRPADNGWNSVKDEEPPF